jgi:hypothetical protein
LEIDVEEKGNIMETVITDMERVVQDGSRVSSTRGGCGIMGDVQGGRDEMVDKQGSTRERDTT